MKIFPDSSDHLTNERNIDKAFNYYIETADRGCEIAMLRIGWLCRQVSNTSINNGIVGLYYLIKSMNSRNYWVKDNALQPFRDSNQESWLRAVIDYDDSTYGYFPLFEDSLYEQSKLLFQELFLENNRCISNFEKISLYFKCFKYLDLDKIGDDFIRKDCFEFVQNLGEKKLFEALLPMRLSDIYNFETKQVNPGLLEMLTAPLLEKGTELVPLS